jgi:hypothetical protein
MTLREIGIDEIRHAFWGEPEGCGSVRSQRPLVPLARRVALANRTGKPCGTLPWRLAFQLRKQGTGPELPPGKSSIGSRGQTVKCVRIDPAGGNLPAAGCV